MNTPAWTTERPAGRLRSTARGKVVGDELEESGDVEGLGEVVGCSELLDTF